MELDEVDLERMKKSARNGRMTARREERERAAAMDRVRLGCRRARGGVG
jgi:hypothetical protein